MVPVQGNFISNFDPVIIEGHQNNAHDRCDVNIEEKTVNVTCTTALGEVDQRNCFLLVVLQESLRYIVDLSVLVELF